MVPSTTFSTPQSWSGEPRFNVSGCFQRDIIMDVMGNYSSSNKAIQEKPNLTLREGYHDNLGAVLHQTKRIVQTIQHKKTKGSMYVSDLWGEKHRKTVIRAFQLDKMYENSFQAKQEEIQAKLDTLDDIMRRKKSFCLSTIPTKVLEEFSRTGLNSPKLKTFREREPVSGYYPSSQKSGEPNQEAKRKQKSISWKPPMAPRSTSYKVLPITLTQINKILSEEVAQSTKRSSLRHLDKTDEFELKNYTPSELFAQDLGLIKSPRDGVKTLSPPILKKKFFVKKIEPLTERKDTEEVTMKIKKLSEKSKTMPFRKFRRSIRISQPRTQSLKPTLKNFSVIP